MARPRQSAKMPGTVVWTEPTTMASEKEEAVRNAVRSGKVVGWVSISI